MEKSYTEILLSEQPNDRLLKKIVKKILSDFNAEIIESVNDLDSLYCNFKIESEIITLHQQTFIGITVFPKDLNNATEKANEIVEQIGLVLNKYSF